MTITTALDRLLEEAIPHRPEPATAEPPTSRYWTPAEQDQHWQDLCAEVGTPGKPRPAPGTPQPERTRT